MKATSSIFTGLLIFILLNSVVYRPLEDITTLKSTRKGKEKKKEIIEKIQRSKAEIVFVGNSVTISAYDMSLLESLVNERCLKICWGGSYTAWWYLVLKNIVARYGENVTHCVFTFRFHHLTETNRNAGIRSEFKLAAIADDTEKLLERLLFEKTTAGIPHVAYRLLPLARLRKDTELRIRSTLKYSIVAPLVSVSADEIDQALTNVFSQEKMNEDLMTIRQKAALRQGVRSETKFSGDLKNSFLPEMMKIAQDADIDLVFVRIRTREEALEDDLSTNEMDYLKELGSYLDSKGCSFISLAEDNRIKALHFRDAHHFNKKGRFIVTKIIADELSQLL